MYSLTVIIPNYNGKDLLQQYLPAVVSACTDSRTISDYEIIIADDCSTDGSIDFIRRHYPEINLITSNHNNGFATNINQGINKAGKQLVMLLNNDIQISCETIDKMIPLIGADTFGVSCAILDPQTHHIQEGRKIMTYSRHKIHSRDDMAPHTAAPTMYLCGGCAIIDRQKLLLLHGFDEIYSPFYFEDMDLGLRALQRGWQLLYTSQSACLHQHSATINTQFSKQYVKQIFTRNRILLNYRFLPHTAILKIKIIFHTLQETLNRKQYRPYTQALGIIRKHGITRQPLSQKLIEDLCK